MLRLDEPCCIVRCAIVLIFLFGITAKPAYSVDSQDRSLLRNQDGLSWRLCNGDTFGLTDSRGREVLPLIYSDIEYVGNGIFLATDIEPRHRYRFGRTRHLFNKDGLELKYRLPEDSSLVGVLSFGAVADADSTYELEKLPPETALIFSRFNVQGICGLNGRPIVSSAARVVYYKPGRALICSNKKSELEEFDLQTHKRSKIEKNDSLISPYAKCEVRVKRAADTQSNVAHVSSKIFTYAQLYPDRLLKRFFADDSIFDPEYWASNRWYPSDRREMFNNFLHAYDLIGMSLETTLMLLGKNSSEQIGISPPQLSGMGAAVASYWFYGSTCTPAFDGVRIYFHNGKVVKWTFADEKSESDAITTNVVLRDYHSHRSRLVNARIGEQGVSTPTFPAVIPKAPG